MIIGNIMAWFQLQGQFMGGRFAHIMKQDWTVVVLGIPIGWLFFHSSRLSYEHFGFTWNIRLIGFGIGTVIFGIMSYLFLREIPTLKTIICLLLALSIILIQVTNVIGE